MFFTSKFEEQLGSLGKAAQRISENNEVQSTILESISADVKKLTKRNDRNNQLFLETKQSITDIDDKVDSVKKSIKKNSVALDDILQEWSKLRKQQKKVVKYIADSCYDSMLESQYFEDIQSLLDLILAYHEQIDTVSGIFQEDSNLKAPLASMNQKLQDARHLSRMEIIGQKDEIVRTGFHEVIDTSEPVTPDSPLVVETVVENGYMYKGRVLRKALVIARAATEAEAACYSLPQVETAPALFQSEKGKKLHEKKQSRTDPEMQSFLAEFLSSLEDAKDSPFSKDLPADMDEEFSVSDISEEISQMDTEEKESALDELLFSSELLSSMEEAEE